ncbi:hypothetical protein [Rossellomorea marisflavi]|uniref:hypothetical protein n=1 Tax=Rossellomorea marisflavi TaxID=189381 RepID=UPI001EE24731|nr:hypothetical protein [Rossellomorea marisflavi]UKS66401.1 hypothetical protein K6T23_05990 [Rossellomorea marisflavi]
MKKGNWWSFILLVTATYIGITAQDLAFGLHTASGLFDPIHYLMILTILSIGLLVFSVIRLDVGGKGEWKKKGPRLDLDDGCNHHRRSRFRLVGFCLTQMDRLMGNRLLSFSIPIWNNDV